MENFDPDEFVTDSSQGFHIFIMSTYTDGEPPESAKWFSKWLQESSNDFRVQKSLLSNMKYAVFGLGELLAYIYIYIEKINILIIFFLKNILYFKFKMIRKQH